VGPSTNIEFLKSLASHPAFIRGDVDTGFINRYEKDLFKEEEFPEALIVAQLALYFVKKEKHGVDNSPWFENNSFRLSSEKVKEFKFFVDKERTKFSSVTLSYQQDGSYNLKVGNCFANELGFSIEWYNLSKCFWCYTHFSR
jgi:3-methylcrotonyl-CoA carboxylase alpha subunit